MANEDILKRIEADRKASAFRNKAQVSDQRLGEFSDVNYSKGFGQLYDKTSSGNYEMKFQNYLGLEGNEDRLAKQQSAWEQVGNGLWKNLQKTGLYAADGINTVTYGLYSAIKDGKMQSLWDNDISNYLDEASKKLDRDFANYYTDEEKSKGFFGRIFTNPANFLANDVAGGLAFIGGAVLPELAIGVLSGGATLPTSLAKFTAKTAFKSADNIASALTREGMEASAKAATVGTRMTRQQAKSGYKALLRGNVGAKAGEVLNAARFVGQTTFFEAGMEARHNFHDSVDGYMNSFQQREGRLPDSAELTEYIKDAGKAADYVFGANVALLSVTNAAMFGKLFNLPSLGLDTKIGKAFGLDVTKLSTGKMAINEATKAQKVLGNTYFLTKKPFSEGVVEEGLQGVFGHTMNNYLDSKYNPNQPDMSLMSSFSEALVEQYTTKEGWFEIGIGAIIGMVGGNVSGDFGVEGVGKKGYGGASRVLSSKVDAYNEGTQKALEGLIRSNSVAAYNTGEEAGIDGSPSFQDTLVSYNYIKANDNLKGYTDTVLDFNAAVDAAQFTEEQKKQFGFRDDAQVEAYKESLKDNFKNDYDTYQEVESIVNNLQIPDMKEGDMKEFKDAVSFSLMAGKKAGIESAKIAENLSQITGIDGIYDTLKFAQEMDEQYNGNIEQLKEKQARLETLKNEILDVGQRLEESKGNEQLYKENSKKHTVLTREIRNLTNETLELENTMEKDFQAMQANITFTPSEFVGRSIKDIVGRMDTLDEYISALKNTGRTKEAQNIEGLVKQFAEYSSAEINSINTMRRMSETNFYSTKEGKAAVKKVRGEDYSMTDQARKEIEENEESVRDILIKNGFEYSNVGEVIEGALKANDKLSEREKFKLESMLRTTLAYQRIQAKLEEVSTTQDAATEDEAAEDFSVEGDTISMRKKLQGKDLTNPETINQLIKDITNEIDIIVNQPTKENLDLIKEKEAQIEALKKQLLEESSTHQVGKESTLGTPSPTSKALSKLLKIKDGATTPIMVEGEQVGEITTETIGDKVHVRRVDITSQNQNLGYAKQAYRQAHKVALKDGKVLASDTLQTNPEATRIWDSLINEGVAIKNEDGTYEMKAPVVDQTFEELLLEGLRNDLESALNSEFGSPEMAAILQEQIDALTEQEIDEVITEIEQEDEQEAESNRQIEGNVLNERVETNQEKLERLNGKTVSINGKVGTLKVVNSNRVEIEDGDVIYEYLVEEIQNVNEVVPKERHKVENLTERGVTVNGVEYTINVDNKGNISSISPINKPNQNITNEVMLVAIEIERAKKEYNTIETEEVLTSVKNNYPNIDKILDSVWDANMTDTVANGLDKLYDGVKLTEQEALQVSIWLREVFDRISILIKKENSPLENDVLLQAYNTAENINNLLYDLNNTKIEQDDNTGENGTNTGAENVSNTNGEGQQDDGGTTDEAVETIDTEILDREEQAQQITESIQRLEDEIAELKVPFKFMDSEGYKRYNELLKKKINEGVLSPEEETELGNLGTSINQWIAITGARVQGIELSDLIKQLQALEATAPVKTSTTQEISDDEVVQDAMEVEDSVRNNYEVGLSFNAVVARRTKSHTVISNISIEDLEEASGVTLQGVPGVEITETKGIKIPHELADEINSAGKIMIINPATDETSTYYSVVLEERPNKVTGEMELYPMDSTFDSEYPDGMIDPEVIFGVKAGEEVAFQIDPNHPYNVDLFNELRKEMGINKPLTEEEFQEEVEKVAQQKALKSKTVIKTQAEIAELQSKGKTTKSGLRINQLNKRLKEQLAEIRTASEDEVLNRKEKKPKKPSAKLIDKLIKKLRISVVTGDTGFNLQVLKGLRESEGYEGTNPHFEALRIKLASDPQALMDLLELNQAVTYNEPVTISKVFMGHPNFIYSKNEDGALVKKSAPIVEEDLDKISDIGYIQNGKLKLRSGKTEDVNTDFVKSALNRKSDTKTPVIVIKKGKNLIAFPAKVAREDSPIDLNRFRSIYESETLSGVDKAIRLNTMLAEAGIDVKQPGNAFIVIGENSLNEDFFNNIFAQLNNKEYLRSVDSWVDAKQSISETLLDNASVNIRLSQPFISPKVKFDFSKIEVQEMPEAKKKSTKKAVVSNKKSALKNFRCK